MAIQDQSKHIGPLVKEYRQSVLKRGISKTDRRFGLLTEFAHAWDTQRPFKSRNSLTKGFVEDWFAEEYDEVHGHTRGKYAGWVRGFLKWGADRELPWDRAISFDPGKISSERAKDPVWLEMSFMRHVWMSQENWYWRGAVALTTLMLRRGGEMIRMRLEQIDMRHRTLKFHNYKTGTWGQSLAFTPWLFEELETYLISYAEQWCKQEGITPIREIKSWEEAMKYLRQDFFLLPRYRKPYGLHVKVWPTMQRGSLSESIGELLVAAMPPGSETAGMGTHTLRRSAAMAMYLKLKQTHPTAKEYVSKALGHSDTRVTDKYLNLNDIVSAANDAIEDMGGWDVEEPTPGPGGDVIPLRRAQ